MRNQHEYFGNYVKGSLVNESHTVTVDLQNRLMVSYTDPERQAGVIRSVIFFVLAAVGLIFLCCSIWRLREKKHTDTTESSTAGQAA